MNDSIDTENIKLDTKNREIDTRNREIDTRNREIELEYKKMESKFELSKQGLMSGSVGVGMSFVTVLFLVGFAYYTAPTDQPVFAGWHIVAIILILVVGLVAYFSLVFWREVKLSAELSEKGIKLDGGTGRESKDA